MPLLVPRSSGNLIETLMALRQRALRRGIWFQTLTLEDRVLANLIQRHVKIVKNTTLATVVARIMGKLLLGLKNYFLNRLETIGRPIANAVAMKAFSYGNKGALDWLRDVNYIRYMGLTFSSVQANATVRTGSGMIVQHEKRNR
jgi:hypothetical protein